MRALARLANTLRRDDPIEEIGATWALKELLRQLLAARDRHRLHRFYEAVSLVDVPQATRLAETIDAWWPQILGFLETSITNGRTEGTKPACQRCCPNRLRVLQKPGESAPPRTLQLHPNHVGHPAPRRPSPVNFDGQKGRRQAAAGKAADPPARLGIPGLVSGPFSARAHVARLALDQDFLMLVACCACDSLLAA